jgi:hypothetical protein
MTEFNINMVCVNNEILTLTSDPVLLFSDVTRTYFTVLSSTDIAPDTIDCGLSATDKSSKTKIEEALTGRISDITALLNNRLVSISGAYTAEALDYGFTATVTSPSITTHVTNFITTAKQNNIGNYVSSNSNKTIYLKFSFYIQRHFEIPPRSYTHLIRVNL